MGAHPGLELKVCKRLPEPVTVINDELWACPG